MIVVDASAMVEALVGRSPDHALMDGLERDVAVPHLLDIEVLSVLRGLVRGHKVTAALADGARADYFSMGLLRHHAEPLAERVWQLRHQFTSHDAAYISLAEALDAPLYTCDGKLGAAGHGAEVVLLPLSR